MSKTPLGIVITIKQEYHDLWFASVQNSVFALYRLVVIALGRSLLDAHSMLMLGYELKKLIE